MSHEVTLSSPHDLYNIICNKASIDIDDSDLDILNTKNCYKVIIKIWNSK